MNSNYRVILRRYGLLIAVIMLYIIFGLIEPKFFGMRNFINIMRQASIMGVLGLSLTFVICAGEFDLSFGAAAALVSCLLVHFMMIGVNVYLAIVICWGLGLVIAFVTYLNVTKLGIPSFIASLAMQGIALGLSRYITGGGTIYAVIYPAFFNWVGRGQIFGFLPTTVVWLLLFSLISVYFLEFTKKGRYIYAVGGNPDAATHVGINVKQTKLVSYLMFGVLIGLAGIMMGSLFGSGNPDMGIGYTFPGIIATLLGGIFIKDGTPNARGTIVGATFLALLQNGFTMTSVPFYMKEITQGVILIISIAAIVALRGKTMKLGL